MTRNYIVINDLHLGVQRQAGTTIESGEALREYGHQMHEDLLRNAESVGADVIVNGDLTDTFDIQLGQALEVYRVADDFLARTQSKLYWSLGNHDLSKDSSKLGTVSFIGALLSSKYPDRFMLISEPTMIPHNVYIIPHLRNQDLFDLALSQVPDGTEYLLLHCNFDNKFAMAADNSLNITREQVRGFKDRGMVVVLGHEHQGRTAFGDKLVITGNQFPSSVSDCMAHGDGQKEGVKYLLQIGEDTHRLSSCWWAKGSFLDIDWRNTDGWEDRQFIRVSGKATAEEADAVLRIISGIRSKSKAFVVANAVQISASDSLDDLADSVEDIRKIDVMQMLIEQLTDEQAAVVRTLLEKQ